MVLSRRQPRLNFLQPTQIRFSRCSSFIKEKIQKSANEKHFSNTQELLKLLDEIIISYMEKERDMLQLAHDQPALIIIDFFSGEMTKPVVDKTHDNCIKLLKIPPNLTRIFPHGLWGCQGIYQGTIHRMILCLHCPRN